MKAKNTKKATTSKVKATKKLPPMKMGGKKKC